MYLVDSVNAKVEAIQGQGAPQSLAPGTGCPSRIYLSEHCYTPLTDALEDFFLCIWQSTYQLINSAGVGSRLGSHVGCYHVPS